MSRTQISTGWLRWAGSKGRSLRALRPILENRQYDYYVDPFVGAGTVFFALAKPVDAVLSDLNADVINFYNFLKNNPESLWDELSSFPKEVSKSYYKIARNKFNGLPLGMDRAATFFFLNRTCFNGVYRINQRGEFNVPYGLRSKFQYPSLETLKQLSNMLQRATILHGDFSQTLSFAHEGSLYYLDPPYTEIAGNPGFNRYSWPPFRRLDLERLQGFILHLLQRGADVIVSYSGRKSPWFVPDKFETRSFKVFRSISCDGTRGHKFEVCAYLLK